MQGRASAPLRSHLEWAVSSRKTAGIAPKAGIERCIDRHGSSPEGLIEILHALQHQQGWLSPLSLACVARGLDLPLSRVLGVASFYHLFALQPPPPHRVGVCLGTACFVRGATALQQRLAQRLAPGWVLEQLSCIGACAQGPVLLVDGQIAGAEAVACLDAGA